MTSLPPAQHAAELTALRRRAYGPDADISADPAAMARLGELERLGRNWEPDDSTTDRSPRPAEPHPPNEAEQPASVAAVQPAPAAEGEPGPIAAQRRWRSRALLWAAVFGVAFGVLATTAAASLSGPRPTASLSAIDAPYEADGFLSDRTIGYFGLRRDTIRNYGEYRSVKVVVGETDAGTRCILVGGDAGASPGWGCAEAGATATASVVVSRIAQELGGEAFPAGSVIRFYLRGDTVAVFEHKAPVATQTS